MRADDSCGSIPCLPGIEYAISRKQLTRIHILEACDERPATYAFIFSGEGTRLTRATGRGSVFCADYGKKITILNLSNESIFVNGNDLLAFETTLQYEIKLMRKVSAMLAGGLFNVRLQGSGMVAITTHYDPMTLPVTPQSPVVTDPNATVMWTGNLMPEFKTDIQFKTFFGRGSGESLQMKLSGNGFVVVQPYEETYANTTG